MSKRANVLRIDYQENTGIVEDHHELSDKNESLRKESYCNLPVLLAKGKQSSEKTSHPVQSRTVIFDRRVGQIVLTSSDLIPLGTVSQGSATARILHHSCLRPVAQLSRQLRG